MPYTALTRAQLRTRLQARLDGSVVGLVRFLCAGFARVRTRVSVGRLLCVWVELRAGKDATAGRAFFVGLVAKVLHVLLLVRVSRNQHQILWRVVQPVLVDMVHVFLS